jgi:carbon starvation protein
LRAGRAGDPAARFLDAFIQVIESSMLTFLIAVGSFFGFIVAYHTYGRWLARRIFQLDAAAEVPSRQLRDDVDFVPTRKEVIFGHHFTSIAGTGPIVGPAIAIMWGWLPALLWVVLGSIFIGAVHDLGSLVISLRNQGQTVGDIAGRVIAPRMRILFLVVLVMALWIVLAIFGLVIASVFRMFPESVLAVWLQIPIALGIGLWLHRRGAGLLLPSIIALALMYLTVWFGAACPGMTWEGGALGAFIRSANAWLASWPVWVWVAVLLAYCYVASVLPVWLLLQPRDYINALQLISTLGLIVFGIGWVGTMGDAHGRPVEMVAPMVNLHPLNAPPIWPFLFITVACGAISGFHCLVSSGTSSKQLSRETDAQLVGYGAMLTEGFLAVLVILAVAAGIGMGWPGHATWSGLAGADLWQQIYGDWRAADAGLGVKVGAFVVGAANFLEAYGINHTMAVAIMGVMVASFAGTTLDTAMRLQRYVIQELSAAGESVLPALRPLTSITKTSYGATLLAAVSAFAMALPPMPGQTWRWDSIGTGGLILWPMFGATNQLLGGLAFLVICFWLWRRRKPVWFAVIPAVFMLVMPAWAMLVTLPDWIGEGNWLLVFVAAATVLLQVWMVAEALLVWPRARGVLEQALPQRRQAPTGSS